jgi:hypothetical protein
MSDDATAPSLETIFAKMAEALLEQQDLAAKLYSGEPYMIRVVASDDGEPFIRLETDIYL